MTRFRRMAEGRPDSDMLEIVTCRDCRRSEYYGCMVWYGGHAYCRKCTYERWERESGYQWHPKETDYVFSKYLDGIDYSEEEK